MVGGEGFEPPKALANGFTVRPGSPTPASAHKYSNANLKASNKYIFNKIKMQINEVCNNFYRNYNIPLFLQIY